MNKKVVYFGIFFIFSILIITATLTTNFKRTNKWQPAETISFSISDFDGTLDGAINQDLFRTTIQAIFDSSAPDRGHDIKQIWVSVNGIGMTFKDAIQNTDLCGIDDTTLNISNVPDPSHLGTEIEISSGKSLQDVINDGSLVKRDGGWSDWSACVNDVRTRTCTNPSPFCGGADCSNLDGGLSTQFCGVNLVNERHTQLDCESIGGTVYTISDTAIAFCKFSGSSCPPDDSEKPDWQQYNGWSKTKRGEKKVNMLNPFFPVHRTYLYYTDSHGFSDKGVVEICKNARNSVRFALHQPCAFYSTTCKYYDTGQHNQGSVNCNDPFTITSTRTEIGCY